ncbi:ClC family H(+)/Cl(-) exchange transporter [Bombilactobacillus folatiphilus]|uniref:ClC family H(+)/Cl(-) exchange transporter n=1 Tax=Bombilactobacillus folatiphilus TaxID=2923362 RepID=UPI0037BFC03C
MARPRVDSVRFRLIFQGFLVGIVTGIVVSLFRLCIEKLLGLVQISYIHGHVKTFCLMLVVNLVLTIFVGWLIKSEPHIAGSGIPEVEGQLQGKFTFHWWPILWKKFIAGVLSIGSGLFLGREGPSIQLGAAVGQGIASSFKQHGSKNRALIAAGATGGLAAAFNAPIAGTMFVLEEIYHNFSPLIWLTSLSSAIGANFVSLKIFGEVPILHMVYNHPLPVNLYGHLLLLGSILGLLGFVYQRVLLMMPKLYQLTKLPRAFQGVIPFVLVIGIGFWQPKLLGGGNNLVLALGEHHFVLTSLLIILVVRFLFSMISYGSGLPGGIFLPILSLGAVIGAIYAGIMIRLGWLPRIYLTNLIIFSMAGYFAGISKAPFTAILLVTEMVGNLTNLMAMAILTLVAYLVVDWLGGAPIYESLLQRMIVPQRISQPQHFEQIEVPVFEGSVQDGQQVRAIYWPSEALLISIHRGSQTILPHGDTMIYAGDTLLLLVDASHMAQVRRQVAELLKPPT